MRFFILFTIDLNPVVVEKKMRHAHKNFVYI